LTKHRVSVSAGSEAFWKSGEDASSFQIDDLLKLEFNVSCSSKCVEVNRESGAVPVYCLRAFMAFSGVTFTFTVPTISFRMMVCIKQKTWSYSDRRAKGT
jgi:hypothetical protein